MRRSVLPWLALLPGLAIGCSACSTRRAHEPQPEATTQPGSPGGALPAGIVDVTWEWVSFTTPVEQIQPDAPARYTIRFQADGRIAMQADCNRGMGRWTARPDRVSQIASMALTRMMCPPGSLGERFAREAGRATIWFQKEGDLYLDLPVDSGTLRFRRQPP